MTSPKSTSERVVVVVPSVKVSVCGVMLAAVAGSACLQMPSAPTDAFIVAPLNVVLR